MLVCVIMAVIDKKVNVNIKNRKKVYGLQNC
jgi:hypothetical protein